MLPDTLTCAPCGRSEIPIDGRVIVLCPDGRHPVFASRCRECGAVACLDCSPTTNPEDRFGSFIRRQRPHARFVAFECPSCRASFPTNEYPVHLFVYESYLPDVDTEAIARFNDPAPLLRLYAFDISRIGGNLPPDQKRVLREDGTAALLTMGVPGVMMIRCTAADAEQT